MHSSHYYLKLTEEVLSDILFLAPTGTSPPKHAPCSASASWPGPLSGCGLRRRWKMHWECNPPRKSRRRWIASLPCGCRVLSRIREPGQTESVHALFESDGHMILFCSEAGLRLKHDAETLYRVHAPWACCSRGMFGSDEARDLQFLEARARRQFRDVIFVPRLLWSDRAGLGLLSVALVTWPRLC